MKKNQHSRFSLLGVNHRCLYCPDGINAGGGCGLAATLTEKGYLAAGTDVPRYRVMVFRYGAGAGAGEG